MQNMRV